MPPTKSANPVPKKRTRKRKRRAISSSSSSSSSDPSSSEDDTSPKIVKTASKITIPVPTSSRSETDSESSDSSSSSNLSVTEDLSNQKTTSHGPTLSHKNQRPHKSPSPSPPPIQIPSFLPPTGEPGAEEKERELKEKFRKFWMSSVADGFRDDLEELRKEPNLGTARLALLIDSLASGAEVFAGNAHEHMSEMDVLLGNDGSASIR